MYSGIDLDDISVNATYYDKEVIKERVMKKLEIERKLKRAKKELDDVDRKEVDMNLIGSPRYKTKGYAAMKERLMKGSKG